MNTQRQSKHLNPALLFALLLMLVMGADSYAQSPCRIGLLNGAAPAAIDGNNAITSGTTREWSDASVMSSGDPCFEWLMDQDTVNKPVRVFSKQYTRGTTAFLGFYVEVTDASTSGPLSSGSLASGERFIIQFDPDHSRGAALGMAGALDFRVVVEHAWQLSGAQITDARVTVSDSNFVGCGVQNWRAGAPATGLVTAAQTMTGGYKFELEIPLSVIGISGSFPASDIGIAFAVINDYGGCLAGTSGSGCPNSGYVAFPSSIPISTSDNPASGCHASWRVPDTWASSSSTAPPPGQVTILRTPDWWNSSSLQAFQCGSTTPGYTFYPIHPCKVELKAWLDNTTGSSQERNIVFLWAHHGSGDPTEYNFISLVHVSVPIGATQGPFPSGIWSGMPHGTMEVNHPCVRAYILPAVLRSDFDGDAIRGITNNNQVNDMVMKYGLIDNNWAQKNITRHETATDCDGGMSCFAARIDPGRSQPVSGKEVVTLSPQPVPDFVPVGLTYTAPARMGSLSQPATDTGSPATQTFNPQKSPPLLHNPGKHILMAPEEFRRFSSGNIIVQMRTFETEQPTQASPSYYRFVRNTGGVIHLFPVAMLQQQGSIPFEFNVTGTAAFGADAGTRVLTIAVDLFSPASIASNVQIAIDTSAQSLAPGEKRIIRGILSLKGRGPTGGFKHWGLSLHAGVSIPHGNFNTFFNPGPNFAVDLEYRINRTFSLEAIYGFHRFMGDTIGPVRISDLNVHQISFNGKVYGNSSPVRPFFNFGGGAYNFGSGAATHGGLNAGGGVQYDVTPTFAVEGAYNFHNVFTSGSSTRFSTLQGGVRFRF